MSIGDRLREERTRLGMSQPSFAALAGTTKQTLFSWESGRTAPDGFQLAALAGQGVDVLFVLTGQRQAVVEAPEEEKKLLNGFRLCGPEARQNLIQTAALFAAGLTPGAVVPPKSKALRKALEAGPRVGSISQVSNKDGTVQVGYAGGKVTVKK
ncbi:MAG: helix-turn-helix domain-containing protein [Delftia sp.]|nr:helix-turn-helix domain-containing protein [Delftia sp.]